MVLRRSARGPLAPPDFFFNDTATTEIYTLSLHDALPICVGELGLLDRERALHHHKPGHADLRIPGDREGRRRIRQLDRAHGETPLIRSRHMTPSDSNINRPDMER